METEDITFWLITGAAIGVVFLTIVDGPRVAISCLSGLIAGAAMTQVLIRRGI